MAAAAHDDEMITGINVTPLVDITLVLLVILMVTASYVASQDDPARPAQGRHRRDHADHAVGVDRQGRQDLPRRRGRSTTRACAPAFAPRTRPTRRPGAVIAADGRTTHAHVVHVIDLLRREDVTKFAINVDPEDLRSPQVTSSFHQHRPVGTCETTWPPRRRSRPRRGMPIVTAPPPANDIDRDRDDRRGGRRGLLAALLAVSVAVHAALVAGLGARRHSEQAPARTAAPPR